MNTGEIHKIHSTQTDHLANTKRNELAAGLQAIATDSIAASDDATVEDILVLQDSNTETEQIELESIEELKKLIVAEFEQLNTGIERYNWMQREVEAHIRNMLHIVNAEHQPESQAERMVASIARDIAKVTISEDVQGPIARSGHNKQFFTETESLSDTYRIRLVEIISGLEQAKAESNPSRQVQIIDETIRKTLENELTVMYSSHEEMARILRAQRDTIRDNVESFRELQYFQDEEVWQNQAYRLLNQYCQQALEVIEAQIAKLTAQSKVDEIQISSLIKESQLVRQRIQGQ